VNPRGLLVKLPIAAANVKILDIDYIKQNKQRSMGQYDVMQVCVNGHQITDTYNRYPEFRKDYCPKCGAETIYKCPNCGKPIKGDYHVSGIVVSSRTPVPVICEYCGKDFPWRLKKKTTEGNNKQIEREPLILLEQIFDRFHLIAKQIRQRFDERETLAIKDEYDVQDLLHSLLHLNFDDIRKEEWNPSYAGSSSRSDFLLKNEKTIIEVKMTRKGLKAKELGEQLIIDKVKYKVHPDCKILYCFVYDPSGYIDNPKGIENDLSEKSEDFKVIVKIVPKGQ